MRYKVFNAEDMSGGATINSESIFFFEPKTKLAVEGTYTESAGTLTAMTVVLQASGDGRGVTDANATWHDIRTYALVAGDITALSFAFIEATGGPFKRYRLSVTVVTGEGAGDTMDARLIEGVE